MAEISGVKRRKDPEQLWWQLSIIDGKYRNDGKTNRHEMEDSQLNEKPQHPKSHSPCAVSPPSDISYSLFISHNSVTFPRSLIIISFLRATVVFALNCGVISRIFPTAAIIQHFAISASFRHPPIVILCSSGALFLKSLLIRVGKRELNFGFDNRCKFPSFQPRCSPTGQRFPSFPLIITLTDHTLQHISGPTDRRLHTVLFTLLFPVSQLFLSSAPVSSSSWLMHHSPSAASLPMPNFAVVPWIPSLLSHVILRSAATGAIRATIHHPIPRPSWHSQ